MRKIYSLLLALSALVVFSCNKIENTTELIEPSVSHNSGVKTKGVDEKTPSLFVYVETNDVNPLNAMDYYLNDGTTAMDYVGFFAANIHKETLQNNEVRPTLYLNPELTPYLCDNGSPVTAYTDSLHTRNQAAILCVIGDWQNMGLSTMTPTQAYQFAYILCCVVNQCGFDGVLFDDEYSGTSTVVNNSYSNIIIYFKQLCPDKLVFVFDWGGTSYISSTAAALIDYAHYGYFGYYRGYSYSHITGMDAARWSPFSLLLGQSYSTSALSTIQTWSANAYNAGYDQVMLFNLRTKNDVDPLPVLNAIATGAGWDTPVICTGGNRAQLTPVTGGCTITYDMALNCCGE